jgi:thymidine kinase
MSLEIVLGPMFSGKSSRILSVVSRYSALNLPILVIKHAADTRYAVNEISTHDQRKVPCLSVDSFDKVDRSILNSYKLIIVEEAQFFTGLVEFVKLVVDTMCRDVILVGLDGDSKRRPFGEILQCIPMADKVEKLTALCARCANGKEAIFSRRLTSSEEQMLVGSSDLYQAVCRDCYLETNNNTPTNSA